MLFLFTADYFSKLFWSLTLYACPLPSISQKKKKTCLCLHDIFLPWSFITMTTHTNSRKGTKNFGHQQELTRDSGREYPTRFCSHWNAALGACDSKHFQKIRNHTYSLSLFPSSLFSVFLKILSTFLLSSSVTYLPYLQKPTLQKE